VKPFSRFVGMDVQGGVADYRHAGSRSLIDASLGDSVAAGIRVLGRFN
jgi:hypothetical protein